MLTALICDPWLALLLALPSLLLPDWLEPPWPLLADWVADWVGGVVVTVEEPSE